MIDPQCYHLFEEFDALVKKIIHCEYVPTAEGHICKCCEVSV